MNLFRSKKGQAQNYIAVVIFLLLFGFSSLLGYALMLGMIDAFTDAGLYTGEIETTGNKFLASIRFFDTIIVLIMAVLLIGIGISSFRLRTSPMFFIVTLVTAALTGLVSYFFNFIFIELISQDAFSLTRQFFPKTILLCTNLHWIALIAIIIGSITLYGKKNQEDFITQE